MDLHLPETDGLTATQRIRQTELRDQRGLIFALTASLDRSTRECSLAAGRQDHLTKPLDFERFCTFVKKFLPDQLR